ncbi:MAG: biopolymer transporter ExbD, partial [Flavobacteriaceae bacterium]
DYKVYIAVQNELVAAYNELRNREFARLNPNVGLTYVEADRRYSDPRTSVSEKEALKPKLDEVKTLFPQKLSEAEPSKTN